MVGERGPNIPVDSVDKSANIMDVRQIIDIREDPYPLVTRATDRLADMGITETTAQTVNTYTLMGITARYSATFYVTGTEGGELLGIPMEQLGTALLNKVVDAGGLLKAHTPPGETWEVAANIFKDMAGSHQQNYAGLYHYLSEILATKQERLGIPGGVHLASTEQMSDFDRFVQLFSVRYFRRFFRPFTDAQIDIPHNLLHPEILDKFYDPARLDPAQNQLLTHPARPSHLNKNEFAWLERQVQLHGVELDVESPIL